MIFLDNASTTPCYKEVAEVVSKYNLVNFFNPSAKYAESINVAKDIKQAGEGIARLVGDASKKVVFVSGATEANNMALNSLCQTGHNIVVSEGEHSSIYEFAKKLKVEGKDVRFAGLNADGTVSIEKVLELVDEKTTLVSAMIVSNETGAISDILTLSQKVKQKNPKVVFHTDAVQAFGKIEISKIAKAVDMLTISAHKIHGPKGVGALLYNPKLNLKPIIVGGGQQNGLRSGTENVSGIMGLALAAKIAVQKMPENLPKITALKNSLIKAINEEAESFGLSVEFHTSENASPYILSLSIANVRGEVLMNLLSREGLLVGVGSACSSKLRGNRILTSMGKSMAEADGNLRLSFSEENLTESVNEIAKTICALAKQIKK